MINFTFIAFMFLTGTWNGRSSKKVHKEPALILHSHTIFPIPKGFIEWTLFKRNKGIWNPRSYLVWVLAVFDVEFRDRDIQTWHVLIFLKLCFSIFHIPLWFFSFNFLMIPFAKKYQGGPLTKIEKQTTHKDGKKILKTKKMIANNMLFWKSKSPNSTPKPHSKYPLKVSNTPILFQGSIFFTNSMKKVTSCITIFKWSNIKTPFKSHRQ